MRGDSESASKNTSYPIFKYPKYSKIRTSENSLASDLVFVGAYAYFETWLLCIRVHCGRIARSARGLWLNIKATLKLLNRKNVENFECVCQTQGFVKSWMWIGGGDLW